MCAVWGADLIDPTPKQIETLKRIIVESQIRGRHQTGLSVIIEDEVRTYRVKGPGELFVEVLDWVPIAGLAHLQVIGHNRYSTSDLRYPQPISFSTELAIAHNGVVTQDPPETWDRYGYELRTSNDSELIYRSRENGQEPLTTFPTASIAMLELTVEHGVRWGRNGKRPLYSYKVKNGFFITSTRDIAARCGLKRVAKCKPGIVYNAETKTKLAKVEELIS